MGKIKARVPNSIVKQKQIENMKKEFATFQTFADGVAQQMVAAMLFAYHLQGYRHKRINDMYEAFLSVNRMPDIFGNAIEAAGVMEFITEKYGVDFGRLHLRTETEEEYIARNLLKNE